MGAVFKAKQMSLDRIVAIKILSPKLAEDKKFCERFITEARAVAKLNHPNIITGINVGKSEKYYYFAMEYVEGKTALELLQRDGPFNEEGALQIARQVVMALDHAHTHGFVHRDIKPDNIMVTAKGEVKLCDLGLAKSFNQKWDEETGKVGGDAGLTQAGTAVGTPHYIAPEQARGRDDVKITADLYALGATLYHMVLGRTLFLGSASSVMAQHLADQAPHPRTLNPQLSESFCRILEKLLAKEPRDRHQTPAELLADIERVFRGAPPAASLPPNVKTSLSPAPRYSQRDNRGTRGPVGPVGRRSAAGSRTPLGRPDITTGARRPVGSPAIWIAAGGGAAVILLVGLFLATRNRLAPVPKVAQRTAEITSFVDSKNDSSQTATLKPVSADSASKSLDHPAVQTQNAAVPAEVSKELATVLNKIKSQPENPAGNLELLQDFESNIPPAERAAVQAEIQKLIEQLQPLWDKELAALERQARMLEAQGKWTAAAAVFRWENIPSELRVAEARTLLDKRRHESNVRGWKEYHNRAQKKITADFEAANDLESFEALRSRLAAVAARWRGLPAIEADLKQWNDKIEQRVKALNVLETEAAGLLTQIEELCRQASTATEDKIRLEKLSAARELLKKVRQEFSHTQAVKKRSSP
jgi:serine/threonine-protein kinase